MEKKCFRYGRTEDMTKADLMKNLLIGYGLAACLAAIFIEVSGLNDAEIIEYGKMLITGIWLAGSFLSTMLYWYGKTYYYFFGDYPGGDDALFDLMMFPFGTIPLLISRKAMKQAAADNARQDKRTIDIAAKHAQYYAMNGHYPEDVKQLLCTWFDRSEDCQDECPSEILEYFSATADLNPRMAIEALTKDPRIIDFYNVTDGAIGGDGIGFTIASRITIGGVKYDCGDFKLYIHKSGRFYCELHRSSTTANGLNEDLDLNNRLLRGITKERCKICAKEFKPETNGKKKRKRRGKHPEVRDVISRIIRGGRPDLAVRYVAEVLNDAEAFPKYVRENFEQYFFYVDETPNASSDDSANTSSVETADSSSEQTAQSLPM